jgi:thiol-disulfide isomerase/thioredoxin
MKQMITVLFLIFFAYQFSFSNWPVSTDPQPRNVVLEEFTGIYCGYCPDGHKIAQEIHDKNPGRVVVIGIHTGSYAEPNAGSGHPDFRTPWGDAIKTMSSLRGYPAGQVNRQVFAGDEYSGSL